MKGKRTFAIMMFLVFVICLISISIMYFDVFRETNANSGDFDVIKGIIRVRKDGSGDFSRIQEAIAFSQEGEIIEIQDNEEYLEDISLSAYPNRTLRAKEGCRPTIKGRLTMGSWCVIEGLKIMPIDQNDSPVVSAHSKVGWVIRNCEITAEKIDLKKYDVSGINVNGGENITIEFNVIHDTFYGGVWVEGGAKNVLIKNNIIYKTQGIRLSGSYGTENVKIISNTLYKNSYGILGANPTIASVIKNNIIVNNSYGIYGSGADEIGYNNVWGNTKANYEGGITPAPTDISVNPLFADPENFDFHLKSEAGRWNGTGWIIDEETSPCIDAGDPASDSSYEPNGNRINLGAYGNTYYASKSPDATNTAPSPPEISITPEFPTENDSLTCNIIVPASDPEGDSLTYIFRWYRNTVFQPSLNESEVDFSYVFKGDVWRCEVLAYDGSLYSLPAVAEVRIEGNFSRPDYEKLREEYCWIQAAIDALPPEGGLIELPEGEHLIYTTIRIDNKVNVTIRGAGKNKTRIVPVTGGISIFGAKYSSNIVIENLWIDGGISWFNVSNSKISNIKITVRAGISGTSCYNCTIERNYLDQAHIIFFCSSWLVVKDNLITSSYWHAIDLNSGNHHWLVTNNTIYNALGIHVYSGSNYNNITYNKLYNCHGGIFLVFSSSYNLVKGNIIIGANWGYPGIIIDSIDGTDHCRNNTIINNLICFGESDGIKYVTSHGRREDASGDCCTFIESNTIYGNGGDGINWKAAYGINHAIIKNNIIANNSGYGINGDNLNSLYNNVYQNQLGNYNNCSRGEGDISVDPLFANPADHDFHLRSTAGRWNGTAWVIDQADSPCIDAGDPASSFDNEPEPNGDRINLGAYGNTKEASKSPGDINPPIISDVGQSPEIVLENQPVTVYAAITDESGIAEAIISYSVDNGASWQNVTMSLAENGYEAQIPGFPKGTTVYYKIIAYDYSGNVAVEDNAGSYYTYTVVSEFPSEWLLLLALTAVIVAVFKFRKKFQKR